MEETPRMQKKVKDPRQLFDKCLLFLIILFKNDTPSPPENFEFQNPNP
jgi:hypothetical protein